MFARVAEAYVRAAPLNSRELGRDRKLLLKMDGNSALCRTSHEVAIQLTIWLLSNESNGMGLHHTPVPVCRGGDNAIEQRQNMGLEVV